MVNRERVLAEFLELIRVDSPTKNERQIADLLKKRLESMGLAVTEDQAGEKIGGDCGNIYAYLKGNLAKAPVVLFSAHMDTVEPCLGIEPVLENGVITSAGPTILGADDKSGIVPILEAIRVIQEQNIPHGDIQIIFSIAEEGGLKGSKNLDIGRLKADVGFVMDCVGGPGEIVLAAPGQDRLNVTIRGKAAHAGFVPEEGLSAIVVAAKAIADMPTGRIDAETTANIGTIQGGRATNIVADEVVIACEARSRDLKKLERQTALMCEGFKNCAREMGGVAEVEVIRLYEPFRLDPKSQVVEIVSQAARSAGLKVVTGVTGGGSDANNFNRYGVPCAVLGTGMQKPHTTEEWIEEEDLYRTTELLIEIVKVVAAKEKNQ